MKPIKLSEIKNPSLKDRIDKAYKDQYGNKEVQVDQSISPTREEPAKPLMRQANGPNKTEARYNAEMLGGRGIYEALTFRLPGGSRYTPDYFDPPNTVHEVKGSYRLHSYGRALTAWREARAAFPMFRFVWAVQQPDRSWRTVDQGGGDKVLPQGGLRSGAEAGQGSRMSPSNKG